MQVWPLLALALPSTLAASSPDWIAAVEESAPVREREARTGVSEHVDLGAVYDFFANDDIALTFYTVVISQVIQIYTLY